MRRRTCPLVFAAACLSLAADRAAAQGVPRDTVRLPELVVTATLTPTPRGELANAVTVLEGAGLERRGVTRVLEALRLVPGLAVVQSGPPGAVTSLFVRGGENDFVRVLVDGVAANQPGGSINFADLTTDNVARIEIVRGPVSALYGSDAVTGVINIITRRGAGPPRATAALRGTERGYAASAAVAGEAGGVGYSMAVSRTQVPGVYRLNHRYQGWTASSLLRAAPDARSDVALSVRHQGGVFHYPTDYTGQPVDDNQYTAGRLTVVGLDGGRRFGEHAELRALLGFTAGEDRAVDPPGVSPDQVGYDYRTPYGRRSADLRLHLRNRAGGMLTVGAAAESQRFRSASDGVTRARANRAAYGQLTGRVGASHAVVTGGVRLEDNERFGRFVTARAGMTVPLAAGTTLRAGAGTAFKEPTFYESDGGGYATGNPDLAPERSLSGEVGLALRMAAGRLLVGATWFAQQFDSLIQYTPVTAPGSPNYRNLAGARARGVEFEVAVTPWRGGSVTAGWTWLATQVRDSGAGGAGFQDGLPLIRRPAHSGTLAVDQALPRMDAGLTLAYVGRRDDLDFSSSFSGERIVMRPHVRVDTRLAWRARGACRITVQIENVMGTRYEEARGFPARGRTVWIGAAWGRE